MGKSNDNNVTYFGEVGGKNVTFLYSERQQYMPDTQYTDAVGDTELISTFIQRTNITDITWIHWLDNDNLTEDVAVCPFLCREYRTNLGYQCVPPHSHVQFYIWTRYPEADSLLL